MSNSPIVENTLRAIEEMINAHKTELDTNVVAMVEEYNSDTKRYLVNYRNQMRYWVSTLDDKRYSTGDEVCISIPQGDLGKEKYIIGKISDANISTDQLRGINSFVESFKIDIDTDEDETEIEITNADREVYNNGLFPFDLIVLKVCPQTNYADESISYSVGVVFNLKTPIPDTNIYQISFTMDSSDMFGYPGHFIGDGFEQSKVFSAYWSSEDLENDYYIDINNVKSITLVKNTNGNLKDNEFIKVSSASIAFGYVQSNIGKDALLLNYDGQFIDDNFYVADWSAPEKIEETDEFDKVRKIGYNKNGQNGKRKMTLEWVQNKNVYNELHTKTAPDSDELEAKRDAIVEEYCQALIKKEKSLNESEDQGKHVERTTEELEQQLKEIDKNNPVESDRETARLECYHAFWDASVYSSSKEILALQKSYTAKYYENYYFYWCEYDKNRTVDVDNTLEKHFDSIISKFKETEKRHPTFEEVNDIKKSLFAGDMLNIKAAGSRWHTVKVVDYADGAEGYKYLTKIDLTKKTNEYKVLILDQDGKMVYTSNPVYFYQENAVSAELAQTNGLDFKFSDSGYNGIYNIYGNDNLPVCQLPTNTFVQATYMGGINEIPERVVWKISKYNSMITPPSRFEENEKWSSADPSYYIYTVDQITDIAQAQFPYQIKNKYTSSQLQNTIICEVVLPNKNVITNSITLQFGNTNTHGTNWTLNIVGPNVYDAFEPSPQYSFELYNPQGILVENPDVYKPTWSWFTYDGEDKEVRARENRKFFIAQCYNEQDELESLGEEYEVIIDGKTEKKPRTELMSNTIVVELNITDPSIVNENYCVLQLVLKDVADGVNLSALMPLAIKQNNKNYGSASVPTRIVYDVFNLSPTLDTKDLYLVNEEDGNKVVVLAEQTTTISDVEIKEVKDDENNKNKITGYRLQYPATYPGQKPCNISFKENGGIVWSQPILFTSNRYGFEAVNDWDGKSIVIDENNNTILTPAFFAGRKDSDNNTFTGLGLGELKTDSGSISNGMFGYHKGENTFAINSDGSFRFGKDNIVFTPGNSGLDNSKFSINVQDFTLDAKNNQGNTILYFSTEKNIYQLGPFTVSDQKLSFTPTATGINATTIDFGITGLSIGNTIIEDNSIAATTINGSVLTIANNLMLYDNDYEIDNKAIGCNIEMIDQSNALVFAIDWANIYFKIKTGASEEGYLSLKALIETKGAIV